MNRLFLSLQIVNQGHFSATALLSVYTLWYGKTVLIQVGYFFA